jgi:hypothetical protein
MFLGFKAFLKKTGLSLLLSLGHTWLFVLLSLLLFICFLSRYNEIYSLLNYLGSAGEMEIII